jgi:outer membrane protein
MKVGIPMLATLAVAAVVATPAAQAQDAGEWIWRAGVHSVQPKSDNHELVNVESAEMITFNGTYMFAKNWGVEVLAALPFSHDITIDGVGKVAQTKHLPPTVSLQYHFNPNGKVRPYIGAGLNYTLFFNEKAVGALAGSDLQLDASFGPAAQLGLDVSLASDWFINADVRWFDIDTDAHLDGASLGTVEIDPYGFGLSIGRRF